jgi:cytochrome c oxidase assembly protein subunit 15
VALLIFAGVVSTAWASRKQLGAGHPLAKISLAWVGLIFAQIILGAVTIWSNKAADIATAHVVTGAISLVTGALLTVISFRVLMSARAVAPAESVSAAMFPAKPPDQRKTAGYNR